MGRFRRPFPHLISGTLNQFPELIFYFMTEKLLAIIFVFINSVISTTGYGGIILLMAIESACIPLPSKIIARSFSVMK